MSRIIKNKVFNLLYSIKFLLVDKTRANILMESEYKLGFIFSLITTVLFIVSSNIIVFFVSKAFNYDTLSALLILFSSFLYWDLGVALFRFTKLFRSYWIAAVFPLSEFALLVPGFTIKRFLYITIEIIAALTIIYLMYGFNIWMIVKYLIFAFVIAAIFNLLMNIAFLLVSNLTKTDSYYLVDFIASLQHNFSYFNISEVKEWWFKILVAVFLVPIYTYLIVNILKGSFLYWLIVLSTILVLLLIVQWLLMKWFKKAYEAYGG